MELFLALLQKNILDRQRWSTREQLRLAIATWGERTYHRKHRQRRLGELTPARYPLAHRTLGNNLVDQLTRLVLVSIGFGYFYSRLQADPVSRSLLN